jgi:hypothetical protein
MIISTTSISAITYSETFSDTSFIFSHLNILSLNSTGLFDNPWYFKNFQGGYNISSPNKFLNFHPASTSSYAGYSGFTFIDECLLPYAYDGCRLQNNTRIQFDMLCQNYVLTGSFKRVWIGFADASPTLGIPEEPNSTIEPFYAYVRAPGTSLPARSNFCQIYEILTPDTNICTESWVHINFTIQEALNNDPNCTVNYGQSFNSFRFAIWQEDLGNHIDQKIDNISITNFNNTFFSTANEIPAIISSDFDAYGYKPINLPTHVNATGYDADGDDIYFAHTCNLLGDMIGKEPIFNEPVESSESTSDQFLTNANSVNTSECMMDFIYRGPFQFDSWNFSLNDKPGQSCTNPFEFYWNVSDTGGSNSSSVSVNYYLGYKPYSFSSNDTLRMEGWDKDFNHLIYSVFVAYDYPNNYYRYYTVDSGGNFIPLYLATVTQSYTPKITVELNFGTSQYRVLIDVNEDTAYDYQSIWYDFIEDGLRLQHLYFATLIDMPDDYFTQTFGLHTGQFYLNAFEAIQTNIPTFAGPYPDDRYNIECSYTTIGTYTIRIWVTDDYHPNDLSSYIDWEVNAIAPSYLPDESTFTNVSILYPDEFNESIFNPPDVASCGAVCQFAWMMGFPSRISHMLDAETGSTTFQIISDAVAFSTVIAALMFLLITMDFNKTIIYTWAYVMIHMFIGYMPLYIFVFMSFMMAIVLAAWKRSMETGLGGRVTGGGPGSDDYVPK